MNKGFKCSVKNKTGASADIYFYGDIVADKACKWSEDDKCPTDVIDALNEVGDVDTLNIYINSGGGDVFAGNAIYNRLKQHKAHKRVHIDALAASIASVIAMAGDEIIMPENSYIMIHKAWTVTMGNSHDLREVADRLDVIEQSIVNAYLANSDKDEDTIKELMASEKWFTASEAVDFFRNVTKTEPTKAAALITDMEFMNLPTELKAQKPTDEEEPKEPEEPEEEKNEEEEKKKKEKEKTENRLSIAENFLFNETEGVNENE